MRKLKKLIRQPSVFFRDCLNKRYPVRNAERRTTESDEPVVIDNTLYLAELENSISLPPIKVDIVFAWVNNQDPKWQQRRRQHSSTAERNVLHNNDEAHFSNHNELYYSLHSVRTLLPWVNHIYIITDNRRSDWFNPADYPNVSIIDHSQIIDPQYLPTLNSRIIEAHLHSTPNLNEHFICLNDDVFVTRLLSKEHFFHANGIASLFIADKSLKQMSERGADTPTPSASKNCITLLQQHYDCHIDRPLVHTYIPLYRSSFQFAWQHHRTEIEAFLFNRFRSNHGLNLATFLVPWLMFLSRKSTVGNEICYYFNICSSKAPTQHIKLLENKKGGWQPHSFCTSNFHSQQQIENYQDELIQMLGNHFKTK